MTGPTAPPADTKMRRTALLDVQLIGKIVDLMVDRDLSEVELRDGDKHVVIKRSLPHVVATAMAAPMAPTGPHVAVSSGGGPSAKSVDDGLVTIRSPMVGTYYGSPDPDSAAFVKIGDSVTADSVVCIIEAMKVFNEIKADVSGSIEQILVKNEQPVEFGQPLFLVRPN
jgi:acetyl-CoA carboxylase biotin carboxyl carrier protein